MRPRAFSMLVTQNEQDIPPILSCSFSTPSCRANASDACVRAARSPRRSGASTLIRTPPLTSYLIAEPLDRLPDLIRAQPRRVERHNDPLGLGVRPRVLDAGEAPQRGADPLLASGTVDLLLPGHRELDCACHLCPLHRLCPLHHRTAPMGHTGSHSTLTPSTDWKVNGPYRSAAPDLPSMPRHSR